MDPNIYVQEPIKKVDGKFIYRCDDGTECTGLFGQGKWGKRVESPPIKKLKPGWTWVCGECQANY